MIRLNHHSPPITIYILNTYKIIVKMIRWVALPLGKGISDENAI